FLFEFQAVGSSRRSLDLGRGEHLQSVLYRKQSLDETMTTDPLGNLCSIEVAPSLSFGNISGTTANIEIKRRAPPIPVITPFSDGKADTEIKTPSP
ncbi:hypothetical protein E2320_002392, partial [Naja naja]